MHACIRTVRADAWRSVLPLTPAASRNTSLSASLSPPSRICPSVFRGGLRRRRRKKTKKTKVQRPRHRLVRPPGGSGKKNGDVAPGGGGLERSRFNFPYCIAANSLIWQVTRRKVRLQLLPTAIPKIGLLHPHVHLEKECDGLSKGLLLPAFYPTACFMLMFLCSTSSCFL